ncbi:YesL family protein [Shouchella lehensis]|uniref:DUF624 domain-containing protein n=2 Tax=Shouchella lehensis TaxID=300825 RepID=A0A060LWT5_9BACI|nr:DUF624 domain-containing protein [Shouchella lehensis]AIC94240.1 hypothetical protein BleG1_1662 [Shouchella lehensis G1]MBG9785855.1 hypothetical protein [Shouchella lehensis]RQW20147.1 DUF624 domain-containing protein [Bacillus sp. C1-1]TES48322.1 DUF624 domain-containing protein [Shouchella lehensis]
MEDGGLRGIALRICDWIVRLAYVNGLWLGFSLLGGVVLGFFPALRAMFVVMRKWCMNEEDFSLVPLFFTEWKRFFWQANKLGYTVLSIGAVLVLDYVIVMQLAFTGSQAVAAFLILCLIVYGLMLLFIGPAFVHYPRQSLYPFLKNIMLYAVASLSYALIMGLFLSVCLILFILVPPAAVCFGGSLFAWITTHVSLRAFERTNQLIDTTEEAETI